MAVRTLCSHQSGGTVGSCKMGQQLKLEKPVVAAQSGEKPAMCRPRRCEGMCITVNVVLRRSADFRPFSENARGERGVCQSRSAVTQGFGRSFVGEGAALRLTQQIEQQMEQRAHWWEMLSGVLPWGPTPRQEPLFWKGARFPIQWGTL